MVVSDVLCGGWSKEGLDALGQYQRHIQCFRSKDEGKVCMDLARKMIQNRAANQLQQADSKAKKPAAKAKSAPPAVDLVEIDEWRDPSLERFSLACHSY